MEVTDPAGPTFIAKISDVELDGSFNYLLAKTFVFVSGDYAYITSVDDNAVTIVNVSVSSSPEMVLEIPDGVEFNRLDGASSVFVSGNYADDRGCERPNGRLRDTGCILIYQWI